MSFGFSHDAKDRVRQAIDIVDLVGSYLQLRREGRGFKALCPWHDDSRPSLQVNQERQSFKCWVCDIGGDIFSFMMKMENVSFPEALTMLADRAGISLQPATGAGAAAHTDEKRILFQAMAWAEQQYHECLLEAPEAEPARRYLDERGVTDESIARYHLGYSPDRWDWLLSRAVKSAFSPKILETVGLVGRAPEQNRLYDRFRGRVLFSIRDSQGRPVGLGGRVLPHLAHQSPAKYVNSPETPLFSKSSLLYGLDLARDAVTKCRNVLVTEGYTDCIVARQFGFENVVAVLGTALGERHIRLLRRFADSITLVLDGDEAGQKRTNEILELFVAQQVDLRILTLPDGLDPCDFLLERGADALRGLLGDTHDALEHKIRIATRGIDVRRAGHEANQALEDILGTLAKAPRLQADTETATRLREQQMLARVAREFGLREEDLRTRLTALRTGKRTTTKQPNSENAAPPAAAIPRRERELLELLLLDPQYLETILPLVSAEQLTSEPCRRIYVRCCQMAAAGDSPTFERLILDFDDHDTKNLLVDLDEQGQEKGGADRALWLQDLLKSFRQLEDESTRRARNAALRDPQLSPTDEQDVLQQLIEQQRSRQGISVPTDG